MLIFVKIGWKMKISLLWNLALNLAFICWFFIVWVLMKKDQSEFTSYHFFSQLIFVEEASELPKTPKCGPYLFSAWRSLQLLIMVLLIKWLVFSNGDVDELLKIYDFHFYQLITRKITPKLLYTSRCYSSFPRTTRLGEFLQHVKVSYASAVP